MEDKELYVEPRKRKIFRWIVGILVGYLLCLMIHSCLIPMMFRARTLARRSVCAANLNAIGRAVALYRDDYNELSPLSLKNLVDEELAFPNGFRCPSARRIGKRPQDNEFSSDYVYIPLPFDSPGELLMAYKLPVNHFQEGANLLQNDGSVYWYDDPGRIAEEIQRVNDHLAELRESGE